MSTRNEEITNSQWRLIVNRIQQGQCIPFLGAGVNRGGSDDENLPLGSELALKILQLMTGVMSANLSDLRNAIRFQSLEDYRQRTDEALARLQTMIVGAAGRGFNQEEIVQVFKEILPDPGDLWLADLIHNSKLKRYEDLTRVALQDLARVSLRYRWETDEVGFMSDLQQLIPDAERKPSSLLMGLAALPFRLLVTTNFDRLMERAMELLHVRDIKNPASLLSRLKSGADELSAFLRGEFSDELLGRLEAFDGQAAPADLLKQAVAELNNLLQEKSLHHIGEVERTEADRATLVGFRAPAEFLKRMDEKPQTYLDVRRNRLLLEAVYADELQPHRPSEVIVQPIRGFQGEEVEMTTNKLADLERRKGVTLFKLHGTFPHGQPDPERRPVITEEDYIEFLTYVGSDDINRLITSKFQDSTLLFLGYGLEDWNFRVLFKGLIEKMLPSDQRMSFAIQKNPSEFWVKYWGKKGVVIYDMDLSDFAEQLEYNFKKYGGDQAERSGGEAGPRPMGRGPIKGGRR